MTAGRIAETKQRDLVVVKIETEENASGRHGHDLVTKVYIDMPQWLEADEFRDILPCLQLYHAADHEPLISHSARKHVLRALAERWGFRVAISHKR